MASSYESFQELNLTRDEVERITDALKDKKFRQLLTEYVDEVRDPENQKLFQKEITQLEKERGVDVTFINPVAGYVIKTSVNGNKKGFINICANEHINKPAANPTVKEGARGLHWSLPHSLAPPREDIDKKGVRCQVYDVVFHPDTLHLAQKNKAFRDMVNDTACDAVESNFEVTLDKKNLKFPKLQYKGFPHAAVIRKPSAEKPIELSPEEKEIMDRFYAQAGAGEYPPKPQQKSPKKARKSNCKSKSDDDKSSSYTTPRYVIKHRRHIEMEEFTEHKNAKINTATPKELIVEVNLPLLKSSADIILDVAEKTLQLSSEKPAKYKLVLTLPYRVNQDNGNAKFDKDQKKLVITLPVKTTNTGLTLTDMARDDSGVESDHGSSSSPIDEIDQNSLIAEINCEDFNKDVTEANKREVDTGKEVQQFLDSNLYYSLPEFTSHIFENTIAFTLNVKNVDETSINKIITDENAIHLKFSSISSGFYPLHYAFYMKLPNHNIDTDNLSVEVWDNNVIVQINYIQCDIKLRSYLLGLDENHLTEKFFEEPSIINEMFEKTVLEEPSNSEIVQNYSNLEINNEEKSNGTIKREVKSGKGRKKGKLGLKKREMSDSDVGSLEAETTETEEEEDRSKIEFIETSGNDTKQSTAIDIVGAYSESSSDEISHSFSPTKSRGILKSISNSRRFGRSISESGLDDVAWTSSIENCHTSVDSVIPEEGEMSTSLKKTVRFNDVVSRQLFRSNSSILGQRKKNQRKAKAKKRAQERRHSEGEISEADDKKERDTETGDECENNENNEKGKHQENSDVEQKDYFANDIFQLDMNF